MTSLLRHTYSELARERKLPVNPPIGAKGKNILNTITPEVLAKEQYLKVVSKKYSALPLES